MKIYADFTFHWFGFYFCLVCCLHEALKSIMCKFNNRERAGISIYGKIYIIEDDENIRNLLKIALEGFGFEAEGFETAEEGLERIRQECPSMAIFDWMLPGMDGVTAIRQIRQTEGISGLPIMLLTAKEKELDKVVGLDCGADDYMVKPFGVLELSARIRSLLRRVRREEKRIYCPIRGSVSIKRQERLPAAAVSASLL